MNSQKGFTPIIIIIVVVAVLGISGAGYLFWQNQALENKVANLKDEKANVEKEFAVFKATDFAKEIEVLNLKLQTRDKELADEKKSHSTTQTMLDNLRLSISATIPRATNIISLMMTTFSRQPPQCYNETDRTKINQALSAFGDSTWRDLWNMFINGTTSNNCSFSPEGLQRAVDYGLKKIDVLTR